MGLENPLHIALLLLVVLLVFGAKRLPEMGRSLGSGLRGFKDAVSGEPEPPQIHAHTPEPAERPEPAVRPETAEPAETAKGPETAEPAETAKGPETAEPAETSKRPEMQHST